MYRNYPIEDCMKRASALVRTGNAVVFQKFTCSGCASRQTMGVPNHFYTHGTCEECGALTNIEASGCNYMLHQSSQQGLEDQYGNVPTTLTFVNCNKAVVG